MLCCKGKQKPKRKRKSKQVPTAQFYDTPLNRPFLACFRYLCSFGGGGGGGQHEQLQRLVFSDVITMVTACCFSSSSFSDNSKSSRKCCFFPKWPEIALTNEELVQKYGPYKARLRFSACPTVLLRAVVPSTGFSVVFRAMLDSGATYSHMAASLAEVLLANGATAEYVWPVGGAENPFLRLRSLDYCHISGLKLQSLEDDFGEEHQEAKEITVGEDSGGCGCPFISVDESRGSQFIEDLPITLVLEKMAQLGLPMTQRSGDQLGRTMWTTRNNSKSVYFYY